MRTILGLAAVMVLVGGPALGQQTTKICVPTPGAQGVRGCQDVDATHPLPALGGVFGATTTIVPLDVFTTGVAPVTALSAGHRAKGGWIKNPTGGPELCINEVGAAATTESGSTACIAAGQTYQLAPNGGAVSVISADSGVHAFSGYGFN